MIKVGIDLTWVRHGIVGGAESYVNNLIDGFATVSEDEIRYYLLVSKDNEYLYDKYSDNKCIKLIICNCRSAKRVGRVLWQNFHLSGTLIRNDIKICIEPVYLKPFICNKRISFITTIHDLQAYHYPQYFNKFRVLWMKFGWNNAVKTSRFIIATSEHAKNDITNHLNADSSKIVVNFDPVTIDVRNYAESDGLADYGIKEGEYYYMVSSLLPHKNIDTVIKALGILKRNKSVNYFPLVISGVGGKSKESLIDLAKQNGIDNELVITPFIDDRERNMLYKYCRVYLAPSLFEGFGLPPIEAMIMGAPLLSTHETCSYEISNGIAEYVDNARDPNEWADKLDKGISKPNYEEVNYLREKYSAENVARIFNDTIKRI